MSLQLPLAGFQPRIAFPIVRPAAALTPTRETLPTGLRALDELLDGGLLTGATHCISGAQNSGAARALYQAVAGAQSQGLSVVYLNAQGRFERREAAAAGVDLGRLRLFRGDRLRPALFQIGSLAREGEPGLVAIDHPAAGLLARLKAILRGAPVTLLALSPAPLPGMQVTLECQRQAWRMEGGAAVGFISELRLTAHPFLPFRQARAAFAILPARGGSRRC